MTHAKKITGLVVFVALVAVGAVLYFGFFKADPNQPNTNANATPASKMPAKDHILGLESTKNSVPAGDASASATGSASGSAPAPGSAAAPAANLETFMRAEYDRHDAECKTKTPGAQLAMGVTATARDSFAVASLGCGESGTSAYYTKTGGQWQLAFKSEDTPTCQDVNNAKFTKEIVQECANGDELAENTNP